jgi:hypothetical protein
MPYKDPEKYKEYQRKYQKKVRDKMTEEQKKQKSEYQKKYMENYQKQRDKYHKQETIYNWKKRNVIETWYYTFDILYDWYMKTTHCENCNIQLTNDKKRKPTTKCLHHIHETGEFEMIVCHSCNVRLK